jgi:3-oxoacyl-[acyl-carrier-protein] synthase-3
MKYSKIIGTGSYLPPKILTNADLEKIVDTTDQWIVERTGIRRRRIADHTETSSSMAEVAARNALEAAQIPPEKIDLIIVATTTPDFTFPSTACLLQARLGIAGCPAFDLTAACAGFSYGLSIADQYIKTGMAKNILIVGSEIISRFIDWTDRSTCVLFGDGAGAMILTASDQPGIHSTHLHANGQLKDLLYVPSGLPARPEDYVRPTVNMQGNELFRVVINILSQIIDETLTVNGIDQSQIDWLIPHQANIRIIQAVAKKLQLPMEKVIVTIEDHGNTSAASIPLALDQGIRDGRVKRGDTLLFEGFGGGMAWGSALITY